MDKITTKFHIYEYSRISTFVSKLINLKDHLVLIPINYLNLKKSNIDAKYSKIQ